MEGDILTNPILRVNTKVKLQDGRTGRLADDAGHRRTRRIDVDGETTIIQVHVKQIEYCYSIGLRWCKCQWG